MLLISRLKPMKIRQITFLFFSIFLLQSCSYKSLLRFVKPPKKFDKTAPPPSPSYSKDSSWHICNVNGNKKQVDVFYVHPTTVGLPKGATVS